jgi:hypothetical protein
MGVAVAGDEASVAAFGFVDRDRLVASRAAAFVQGLQGQAR